MKYVSLGSTGIQSSIFALGAMTFGEKNNWNLSGLNQEIVTKMVNRAYDEGINFFDTADIYDVGESEKLLGKALKPIREEVILATKVRGRMSDAINDVGLSRYHIQNAIKNSLTRLDTKYVDVYQFHGWDNNVPLDESLETMQDLIEDKLVRYPGISNFSAWQMATLQARCEERGYSRYVSAQMNYNLLNRDLEHEILPFLNYSSMSLLVWSPLHGGMLTGKYKKDKDPESGTRMGDRGFFFPPFDESIGYDIVDLVRKIGEEQGATPAQISLAWLVARKHIIILGARTMDQFEENMGALDINLTSNQMDRLDEISKPPELYPEWMIKRQNSS